MLIRRERTDEVWEHESCVLIWPPVSLKLLATSLTLNIPFCWAGGFAINCTGNRRSEQLAE